MKRTPNRISQERAIFLVIAGLLLGTIFTFGMHYWHAPISRENCAQVETEFISCRECIRRGNVQRIDIDCANGQ